MTDIFISIIVLTGIVGIKKPIYGGIAGLIIAPLIHHIFQPFSSYVFFALFPMGFVIGLFIGKISNWFFSGFRGGKHNVGPSYISMTGRAGGNQRGGIVYTDEEMKNAKANQNTIN
jgi:hypothetical protein